MSCGVGRRHYPDPALLWLWLAAIALIRHLAWELLYAAGAALESKKKKKKKKKTHLLFTCVWCEVLVCVCMCVCVFMGLYPPASTLPAHIYMCHADFILSMSVSVFQLPGQLPLRSSAVVLGLGEATSCCPEQGGPGTVSLMMWGPFRG